MNRHWLVQLGDITTTVMGQAPPGSSCNKDGHGTAFVKAGEFGEREPVIREWTTKPLKMSRKGDVLVCVVGATAGKINLAIDSAIGRSVAAVRPDASRLNTNYLHHFLATKVNVLRANSQGLAQGVITKEMLASLTLHLPPLDEQRRIAAILDKAEALRQMRKRAIALLDSLTQSIFLEMFGDPATNPRKWLSATLGDAVHKASDGPHVSPSYVEEGVPFLSTRHISREGVSWQDLKYIAHTDAEIHWRKCKPEYGDLLYTKGGTTGIACVVDFDRPVAVWVHVALLKTKLDVVDPVWFAAMLNTDYCYGQSQFYTHGIANRDLGLKRMVKILMYMPPLELQQEFSRRAAELRSLSLSSKTQLQDLDTAFASLQHRAFSGQL